MTPIIRAFDAKLEVIPGERAVVAKINTDAVDRYRTVIDPAGMTLENYRKNPVVLCNHGEANDGMPVGRSAWIKYIKAERAIVSKTIFLEDEYSDGLFRMAQAGVMNAYSVRIVPQPGEYSSPTPEEIRRRPELAECYCVFRKSDLAEYSIVNVPGNPEALALAVSRGLALPDRLRHDLGEAARSAAPAQNPRARSRFLASPPARRPDPRPGDDHPARIPAKDPSRRGQEGRPGSARPAPWQGLKPSDRQVTDQPTMSHQGRAVEAPREGASRRRAPRLSAIGRRRSLTSDQLNNPDSD